MTKLHLDTILQSCNKGNMFSFSCTTPCPIQGEISVRKPIHQLGIVQDIFGARWHIGALLGGDKTDQQIVGAVPLSQLHGYYTDTSTKRYGVVSQEWLPYRVKLVRGDDDDALRALP